MWLVLILIRAEHHERQPLEQLRAQLVLGLPRREQVQRAGLRDHHARQQLLERGLVVRHHVVDGGAPEGQALLLHAEEGRLEQQVERLSAPGPPRVLVLGQRGQQLRARQERGRVRRAAAETHAPGQSRCELVAPM